MEGNKEGRRKGMEEIGRQIWRGKRNDEMNEIGNKRKKKESVKKWRERRKLVEKTEIKK